MSLPPLELPTRCAHWGWDDHRYFGYAAFADLLGRESLMGLFALSITGRRCSPEHAAVLDEMAAAALLGDPRIWPLKLTRVVAAYGGALPAVAAGLAIFESARLGPNANARAAHLLVELHAEIDGRGEDTVRVQAIVEKRLSTQPVFWGFGVPFRTRDERLVAFRAGLQRRGRDTLSYFRAMDAISVAVRSLTQQEPNMAIGAVAACLDMNFSADEAGLLSAVAVEPMLYANAAESARQAPRVLQCLPTKYVEFHGKPPRLSPRELEGQTRKDTQTPPR